MTQPPRSVPWNGGSIISPPNVRSRSHGRPLARWSDSEVGWYCTDTQTSAMRGVLAVAQREVDQPVDPGEGDGRLGPLLGQQLEPAAGAAGQHEDEDPGKGHALPLPGPALLTPGPDTRAPGISRRPRTLLAVVPARRLPPTAAFWSVAVLLVLMLAASGVPSPLYRVYQEEFGFSSGVLTTIFGIYSFALLASLLVVGGLSDHVGRRPVLIAAFVLEAASMALFLFADGVGWLLAARVVQGLATGALTSTLGAALLDLQHRDRPLGAFINSASPGLGLSLGAVGAGLLVQFVPSPTDWVFGVLTVVFLLAAVGTLPAAGELRRGCPARWRRCARRCTCRPRTAGPSSSRCRSSSPAGRWAGSTPRSARRWSPTCSASTTTSSAGC